MKKLQPNRTLKEAWELILLTKYESIIATVLSLYLSLVVNPFIGWATGMVMNIFLVKLALEKKAARFNYEGWMASRKLHGSYVDFLTHSHEGIRTIKKNLTANPQVAETFLIVLDKRHQEVLNGVKLAMNGASEEDVLKAFDEA